MLAIHCNHNGTTLVFQHEFFIQNGFVRISVYGQVGAASWPGVLKVMSVFLARPHPDLLPRGEGTASGVSGFANECPANPIAAFSKKRRTILLLPGGEGRDEGEPIYSLIALLIFP
jgi:hypothetical protein